MDMESCLGTQIGSRSKAGRRVTSTHHGGAGSSGFARYSRSSLARGSIRGGDGSSAGWSVPGFERVRVIDDDGTDRTPKPLTVPRAAAAAEAAAVWGPEPGDSGAAGGGSSRASIRSALGDLPAVVSFLSSSGSLAPSTAPSEQLELSAGAPFSIETSATELSGPQEQQVEALTQAAGAAPHQAAAMAALAEVGSFLSADHANSSGMPSTRPSMAAAEPAELAGGPTPTPAAPTARRHSAAKQVRSKAAQCSLLQLESQGVQVAAWELAGAAVAPEEGAGGTDAATAAAPPAKDEEPDAADADQDAEAMEAMQAALLLPHSSPSSSPGHGMHSARPSEAPSSRASVTGWSSRQRSVAQEAASRRESELGSASRRASTHAGESTRTSMVSSRTSFAAFFADGRASIMGGVHGGHAGPRASVLSSLMQSAGGGRTPLVGARPALTPQEAAAAAERRHEAEVRRATARLPSILQRLALAERAVLLNSHQTQVAAYRNVQVCLGDEAGSNRLSEAEASGGEDADKLPPVATQPSRMLAGSQSSLAQQQSPDLRLLWTWAPTELTAELPVSCLAWNRASPDLLAVGYGRPESAAVGSGEGRGLLAVYSLRNPVAPHWYAPTPCGVSALDFGPAHAAGTLAAGFYDGSVALYDVRAGGGGGARPLARAPPAGADGSGGHADVVCQLRYVHRGGPGGASASSREAEEALLTISSDGLLAEWKLGQGLERLEVVRLKRQAGGGTGAHGRGGGQGRQHLLGTHAGGTCFDFSPSDPRTYLVGTDEGGLHRRSTAFADAPGQNYVGHVGVLYQVAWSPFDPTTFLSCGSDCAVRLWSADTPRPLCTFAPPGATALKAEVADVAWCPQRSTAFAAAAGHTLQLWDVEHSALRPRAAAAHYGIKLCALRFSPVEPVLAVGGSDGSVSIYSMAALLESEAAGDTNEEVEQQRERLRAVLHARTENKRAVAEE